MSTTAAEDRATAKLFDSLKPLEDSGDNFSTWKYRQIQIFEYRGLDGYINGSVIKPDETDAIEFEKWKKNERTARMQISMHVGEDVLQHIMDKDSAAEMWKAILAKFGGKGAQSAVHLIHSICRSTS